MQTDSESTPSTDAAQAARSAASASHARAYLVIGLFCTALTYLNTLWFGFVYDDHQISRVPFSSLRGIPHMFTQNMWAGLAKTSNYYRPVLTSWSLILSTLFGTNTVLWHLEAVTLHLCVTLVLFGIFLELSGDKRLATIGAGIFGLHPVHAEVVAWASGATSEGLLALLFFSAFYCYVRSRRVGEDLIVWRIAALFLAAAASFTKETAVALPVLIAVYEMVFAPCAAAGERKSRINGLRSSVVYSLPFFLISGGYILARFRALHSVAIPSSSGPSTNSLFLSIPEAAWFYVSHLLFPVRLSLFYSVYPVKELSLANFWLPLAGVAAFVAVLVWASLRSRLAFIASAITVTTTAIPLLGISALPRTELVHDRYLYLPSAGISLLVAMCLCWALEKLEASGAGISPVLPLLLIFGLLSATTISQTLYWTNDLALYSRGVNVAPDNPAALSLLANEMYKRHRPDVALRLYSKAVALDPADWKTNFAMGVTELELGQFASAEQHLAAATRIDPSSPVGFEFLGRARFAQDEFAAAEQSFRHKIALQPEDAATYYELGIVLIKQNRNEEARRELQQSLALDPTSPARQALTGLK